MLELIHISYRVSTPEGDMDIIKDISITIPDHRLMVFTRPQRRRQDHAGQDHHGSGAAHQRPDLL